MIFGRAKEGDAVDDSLIDTCNVLSSDGDIILYNRDFLTQHGGTSIVAAEVAIKSDNAISVLRIVPMYCYFWLVLPLNNCATLNIPTIAVTRGIVGTVGDNSILANCTVTTKVKYFPLQDFDDVMLLIVASAIVVHTVYDLVLMPYVFNPKILC